jgi:hypothetical protein
VPALVSASRLGGRYAEKNGLGFLSFCSFMGLHYPWYFLFFLYFIL